MATKLIDKIPVEVWIDNKLIWDIVGAERKKLVVIFKEEGSVGVDGNKTN